MAVELALALLRDGRAREALDLLEGQIAERPSDATALFFSAIALEDLRRTDEALACYEHALEARPYFDDALHNRGLLLARLGRFQEAERSHREYVERFPDSPRAHADLGDVLLAQGRYSDAVGEFTALVSQAHHLPSLVGLGMAQASLGQFDESTQTFDRARRLDHASLLRHLSRIAPGSNQSEILSPQGIYLWRNYVAQGLAEWTDWERYVNTFRQVASDEKVQIEPALAFVALHLDLSARERLSIARRIARTTEERFPPLPARAQPPHRSKIRIGILSPDFREHLNSYLLLPLFELLDRETFELHAYSLSADDGSAIRRQVLRSADGFTDLTAASDVAAAQQIRNHGTDILVDIGGYSSGGRFSILAQRPATTQITYLGFPGSLGSSRVDYAIVDRVVAPDQASSEWSEALIRLPHTYYLYDFRDETRSSVARTEYGLPNHTFVFCAFHKTEKITPDTFALWMRILALAPESILWLQTLPREAERNLRRAARGHGVDPSRLFFAPYESRSRYLSRQALGDLMLDALHHNAMTTACDALGGGLPLLTLKGNSMASRAGESLLCAAGLDNLVAASPEDFVDQAVRFYRERTHARSVRERLERNRRMAPLFDTSTRVRELATAFVLAHERALRMEKPASFDL